MADDTIQVELVEEVLEVPLCGSMAPGSGSGSVITVEAFTLTTTQITDKKVILANNPVSLTTFQLIVDGAPPQLQGLDYAVVGVNVSWDSLRLDGQLREGDLIYCIYEV